MSEQDVSPVADHAPDKVVELGPIGKIELDFHNGLAYVKVSASVPGQVGVEGGAFVSCDSEKLIDALFAAIEKKLPAGATPLAEGVKAIIVGAVKSIP